MKIQTVSMTGFGKASVQNSKLHIGVELKSYNHRFLDIALKLPRAYNQFEFELRDLISSTLGRGRVELLVVREAVIPPQAVQFDRDLFKTYWNIARKVLREADVTGKEHFAALALDLMSRKEVLGIREENFLGDAERGLLLGALKKALGILVKMRDREGARLGQEISGRFARIKKLREQISKAGQRTVENERERIQNRIKKFTPEVTLDPARLAAEVALLIDRTDITEELVRLDSHFKESSLALAQSGTGRKLDFIIQELGREFNTIGSKAQDADVQRSVIEAKVELEKIREQVQNLV